MHKVLNSALLYFIHCAVGSAEKDGEGSSSLNNISPYAQNACERPEGVHSTRLFHSRLIRAASVAFILRSILMKKWKRRRMDDEKEQFVVGGRMRICDLN